MIFIKIDFVWKEFNASIRLFINDRIADKQAAEDVFQEVFLSVYKNRDKLKDDSKLKAWLFKISRNKVIDYYRKNKLNINYMKREHIDAVEPSFTNSQNMNSDICSCIKPMINSLPEKYRLALLLYEYDNLTQKEIAEKFCLSVPGAKSRIQRARKKLREMLLSCCKIEFDKFGNVISYEYKHNNFCECKN
jgi:RNA polymerase sigma-70 factor (ECF subfamily)